MRCSSCGGSRPDPQEPCPACGGEPHQAVTALHELGLRQCASCAYRGEGVSYFRRPVHAGVLVVLALLTYGIGALVYWLVKRDARICPACGVEWHLAGPGEAAREALPRGRDGRAGPPPAPSREATGAASGVPTAEPRGPLPPDGGVRRGVGWVLLFTAAGILAIGAFEVGAPGGWIAAPMIVGGFGGLSLWWGRIARGRRRRALFARLEHQALELARTRGGELTASEVATALGISLSAAERVLFSMDDGLRVRSEVTDEGLLLFEFPEFRSQTLPPGRAGNP